MSEVAVPRVRRSTHVYREKSQFTGYLAKSLAKAQGEFGVVVKDSTGQYGAFASLASMKRATVAAMAKYGLSVTIEYADVGEAPYLIAVLNHESGEWISSVIRMERISDPQKKMAYMTYMKRAAYSGLLCLAAEEDDDGEVAASATAEVAGVADEEKAENFRLAKDALRGATSLPRIAEIMSKVHGRWKDGVLDDSHVTQLRKFADARQAAIGKDNGEGNA